MLSQSPLKRFESRDKRLLKAFIAKMCAQLSTGAHALHLSQGVGHSELQFVPSVESELLHALVRVQSDLLAILVDGENFVGLGGS